MSDRAWETLDSQLAYTCDGFDIVNERIELPDGEEGEFDYLSNPESVVILPFTSGGEVVVIDEWRQAVKRENRGIPAGSMEPGEDPERAASRELREETGYEAGTLEKLCAFEPSNGLSNSYFHYYVARDCEPSGEQSLDENETITVETMEFDDLLAGVRSSELKDGRTATAVLYYALFEA